MVHMEKGSMLLTWFVRGVSCPTYLCIQVEVKSGADGFIIKMRDGRNLRCVHNSPHGGLLPDYAPHPAIVLKMEDGTGLLLPIIVLEMPSVLLMAAVRNVQIAKSTLYQVVKEMIDKMVMKSELAV
ncbi:Bifunctional nuclease 1 [Trifolium repens]|nr:Bifunctional nuclease 1 [Trifolium repens]